MSLFIDFKDGISKSELEISKETIDNKGILVFPTETVYALGTSAFNEEGIKKIFEIKNRPLSNPISVLVSDITMIRSLVRNISPSEEKLIEKFFPGPLTIVFDKKDTVPDVLTAGEDTIGIRMPDNEFSLKLIKGTKTPLAATSANLSGKESGTNIESIKEDFGNLVDCYIDGGESQIGIPSTVVRVEEGKIRIIREGTITKEELEEAIL